MSAHQSTDRLPGGLHVNAEGTLTEDQRIALEAFARAYGWDNLSTETMALVAWAAFHYYAGRL